MRKSYFLISFLVFFDMNFHPPTRDTIRHLREMPNSKYLDLNRTSSMSKYINEFSQVIFSSEDKHFVVPVLLFPRSEGVSLQDE